ncbi:inositol monophosphatase family protein [Verrucomicrobiota bacterium]
MNREPDNAELLECAVEAAQTAGGHALRNLARRSEAVARARHDVKLQLDIECQEKAVGVIASRFPEHAILGEEDDHSEDSHPRAGFEWIVDPIDGTVNFSHGLPMWCCSIAVRRGERTLAGAVFAPVLDQLYTATVDQSALLNDEAIRVSDTERLPEALVTTGMDKDAVPGVPPFAIFRAIAESVQKARILGCAALDICRVAVGHADGYFESGIYIWDIAAAGLIVERAGGRTETLSFLGRHRLQFLASNGLIHEDLKRAVRAVLDAGKPNAEPDTPSAPLR